MNHFHSINEALHFQVLKNPHKIAVLFLEKDQQQSLSYKQLYDRSSQIAQNLRHLGVQAGDRVVCALNPGLGFIETFFACIQAACIAVPNAPPINNKTAEKLQRIIENCQPSVVIVSLKHLNNPFYNQTTTNLDQKIRYLAYEALLDNQPFQYPYSNPHPIAFLQYTSGSTSFPKGVIISHRNLLDNIQKIISAYHMNDQTILYSWLPPYHDMGLIGCILTPICGGFLTINTTAFTFLQSPHKWLRHISEFKVTISVAPNFAYDYCVKRVNKKHLETINLSSWQLASNGAEPIHATTMEQFYNRFAEYGFNKTSFYPCYGLAEATLLVAGGDPNHEYKTIRVDRNALLKNKVLRVDNNYPQAKLLVSCGSARHQLKIVNPEQFQPCQNEHIGEIWIHSPSVAEGYWALEKQTLDAFYAQTTHDSTYYLRTGDLGFISEGELYVTGRIKDLLILNGKNYYPQDLEYSIMQSCVHQYIERCAAFIIPQEREELYLICELKNNHLPHTEQHSLFSLIFKIIFTEHSLKLDHIILVPKRSIPLTTSGKIRRSLCRKNLLNSTLIVLSHWNNFITKEEE